MNPGEYLVRDGDITCNPTQATRILNVVNRGDRPVQIGSHYHFAEVNPAIEFDRDAARGFRLDAPAGTAVRLEPGDERTVHLVEFGGRREVFGFRDAVNGPLGEAVKATRTEAIGGTAGIDEDREPKTAEAYRIELKNESEHAKQDENSGMNTGFGSDPVDPAFPPRPDRVDVDDDDGDASRS